MRKIISLLLCIFFTLFLVSCSSEPKSAWIDDFSVQCKHIEKSNYNNPMEELDAILAGSNVQEHDEYTITNKSNCAMQSVELLFRVDIPGYEPFEFYKWVGTMKQGASETVSITETLVEIEMDDLGMKPITEEFKFPFDFNDLQLVRIDYEKIN